MQFNYPDPKLTLAFGSDGPETEMCGSIAWRHEWNSVEGEKSKIDIKIRQYFIKIDILLWKYMN